MVVILGKTYSVSCHKIREQLQNILIECKIVYDLYSLLSYCKVNQSRISLVIIRSTEVFLHKSAPTVEYFEVQKREETKLREYLRKSLVDLGIPMINFGLDGFNNKMYQLEKAAEIGVMCPPTLLTDSKIEVLSFLIDNCPIITKPLDRGLVVVQKGHYRLTYTTTLDEQAVNALPDFFYPSLFQKRIAKKAEIRLFIFLELSYCLISPIDSEVTDIRIFDSIKDVKRYPFKLDDQLMVFFYKFLSLLGLESASFDLLLDHEDNVYFLEANPFGEFDHFETFYDREIYQKIAECLRKKI